MSLKLTTAFAVCMICIFPHTALAGTPPMPANTSGTGVNGMIHARVGLVGQELSVSIDSSPPSPVIMASGYGVDYTPDMFNVLENKYFNAQYGWLPNGFISLPANRTLWIERTGVVAPAGASLHVYEAGMAMELASWTMSEIYAADGDKWQWDGAMQHDYYVADKPGSYSMQFKVYVGDSSGVQDLAYPPATTALSFVALPEPSTAALAIIVAMAAMGMRRT